MGEGEEAEKHADQTTDMMERASMPLSICLSDPQGRDETVAQEGAQNSVKKGVHFGTHRSRVSVHASHKAHGVNVKVSCQTKWLGKWELRQFNVLPQIKRRHQRTSHLVL